MGRRFWSEALCEISRDTITVRFHVGFPAFGRTIDAGGLEKILFDFLPKAAEKSFFTKSGPKVFAGSGMAG
ncbi:MAG: ABC-ATPase domain-containing protein [Clostridium sp.]